MDAFLSFPGAAKLFIIDHSPGDQLRETCRIERVEYAHHPENKGFGAGHNIAIRKVIDCSPFHLVLNPDVYFDAGVIPRVLNYFENHPDTGHIMPRVVNEKKEIQFLAKLLPAPADLFFKRFLPGIFIRQRSNRFQLKFTGYDKIMNVPYLSGCCMFLRTEALKKAGLFDERFFMYPDDIDLTRRIHRHYRTLYFPEVTITHRHEASSYKSVKMLRVHLWNLVKYFNKWGWYFDRERKEINRRTLQELKYYR